MDRQYVVLDVFTNKAMEGNPLAVVLDPEGLDTQAMQAIAREFGLPETVFVCPPSRPGQMAKLKIFTPGRELDFAGHPTVGTAVLLATRRLGEVEKPQDFMLVVEENVGTVRCAVKLAPGKATYAEFEVPKMAETFSSEFGTKGAIADALGLAPNEITFENHRPSAYTCGAPFIFVPVSGLDAISKAKPNVAGWKEAFGSGDRVGVYLYTRECVRHTSRFHARMFAPESGIIEDPATGGAAAAFAGVIRQFDEPTDGTHHYAIEQGFEMGRPSIINLALDVAGGKLKSSRIGGHAVIVAEGVLHI
jgi:trans-2,3-dihydro-3-hydroxyanthranilate isomerase